MNKLLSLAVFIFSVTALLAQYQPPNTVAADRLQAFEQRKALQAASIVNTIAFESVGPSVFSGRVVDIAVSPTDPSHFYVAYASGGLWKTTNNGTTFEPLFDKEAVMTIGDITVDWERNTIWVGTGENNSSRSSYAGLGMYKSTDGGKTWQQKGLLESHHIGRIIQHPTNPNTIWVAVLGHLYSPNKERGIYKTTDGGETWEQTLFVNDNAGGVDLVVDPNDANTLYAGIWERERRAWNFVESGNGSGIYKSTDGGNNWTKITNDESGFPDGAGVGRIGLAIHANNGQSKVYAILDNNFREEKKADKKSDDDLVKADFAEMTKAEFLALDQKKVAKFLKTNRFPKKYSPEQVTAMIQSEKIKPAALKEYLEDANSLLFDTPVVGAEVYATKDGGQTWSKTHEDKLEAVHFTYGYYFGQVRVAPSDPEKIYILGYQVLRSDDGGKDFKTINGDNVHADHHALYINPNRPGHLILGNDGGINISYDDGENWTKCNTPAVGQFYSVAVDMAEPYNIYGGLQDNGVWMGASNYKPSTRWHSSGQYPYKSIMGGDGMQVAVDTRDNTTVYTGFQFGNYFRLNTKTGTRKYITPKHELGDRPLRWNWQSPIQISTHNQDIVYFASNKLHRSMNQGDDFAEISGDLTTGGKKGDVAFSTITSIHESPKKFGLIYVGTDDGLIHVTKDGGYEWQQITEGLPADLWVTRVWASAHEEGTVYAALNGYRWDDFSTYVYISKDYGATWQSISGNLPNEPVNTIKDDAKNPNILYVGTDNGLYVSLDKGASYMLMDNNLPAVAVHDLVVHPTTNDLVVGTHGRSIYKANIEHLQALTDDVLSKEIYAFQPKKVKKSSRWGTRRTRWNEVNEPKVQLPFYSNNEGSVTINIHTKDGVTLQSMTQQATKGLNFVDYDLSLTEKGKRVLEKALNANLKKEATKTEIKAAKDNGAFYLTKGTYKVEFVEGGKADTTEMTVE
ncbi:MAG: glycosyl hydrolase [Bacteroidota bacterium]